MKKRMIAMMMALTLLFGASTGAAMAAETAEATDLSVTQQELLQKVTSVLRGMQADTEAASIYNVDFTQLSLGTRIPAYVVEQTGLVQSEIDYYPIFDGDGGLAFLVAATDAYGELYVQVTTELVDELNVYLDENDTLALVYDRDGLYALSDTGSMVLAEYDTAMDARGSLLAMQGTNPALLDFESGGQIACAGMEPVTALEVNMQTRSAQAISDWLAVPIVQQGSSDTLCWACCVSSVGKYYTGTTNAPSNLANSIGKLNSLGSAGDIIGLMHTWYNITGYTEYTHETNFTSADLIYQIGRDDPVFALMATSWSVDPHWLVYRGYSVDGATFTFSAMDPYSSVYTSGTVTANSDGTTAWLYTHVKTGDLLVLHRYVVQ